MKKRLCRGLVAALLMIMVMSLTGMASAQMVFFKDRKGATYADFYISGDTLVISPELENVGTENVNYIELALFCTDEDFNPIYPDDGEEGFIRYFDSSKGYDGGLAAPFGRCRLKGCKDAEYVFCAILKFHYRDGDMVDLADTSKTSVLDMYEWNGWAF